MVHAVGLIERFDCLDARLGSQGRRVVGAEVLGRLRREHIFVAPSVEFRARLAEGPLGRRIGEHIVALGVLDPRQPRQTPHEAREPLFAFLEGLLPAQRLDHVRRMPRTQVGQLLFAMRWRPRRPEIHG